MIDLSPNPAGAAFHDNDEERDFEASVHYRILRDTPREESVRIIIDPPSRSGPVSGITGLVGTSSGVCYDVGARSHRPGTIRITDDGATLI